MPFLAENFSYFSEIFQKKIRKFFKFKKFSRIFGFGNLFLFKKSENLIICLIIFKKSD